MKRSRTKGNQFVSQPLQCAASELLRLFIVTKSAVSTSSEKSECWQYFGYLYEHVQANGQSELEKT